MSKLTLKEPFFVFNPKSYLYGDELLELAMLVDRLGQENKLTVLVTAPYADLQRIKENTSHVIVTAQHMDGLFPGQGMGHVLPESLYNAGARATFLNHAERPLSLSELSKAVERADELGIITIVCADSILEAKSLALLNPDIILCEPTELIGSGQTSSEDYIKETNEAIKALNPDILVMQAAGISTAEDVYRTISLGADGTGATSGITEADNPKEVLTNMIMAVVEASK